MVSRDENYIVFTPEEQAEFSVPERTLADDAVRIADGFREAGLSLIGRNVDYDATNRQAVIEAHKRASRAQRLGTIQKNIVNLCFDEQIQLILDNSEAESR